MGLPKSAVHLLLLAARSQPFSGQLATLGRQHVYLSEAELRDLARRNGIALKAAAVTLHRDPELQRRGFLSDDSLYELLGFDHSTRIDHSDYEAAEVRLNLNDAETPPHLQNRFDMLLDSGTVEHIFELPHALAHCLRMTRIGGRIVHLTPSSNSINHGFYSVSPTLYADFYSASGCEIEALYLCRVPRGFERRQWQVYDCQHNDRQWGPIGGLAGNAWFTFCIVRKLEHAEPRVPQQSQYEATWQLAEHHPSSDQANKYLAGNGAEPADTKAGKLLKLTEPYPFLQRSATAAIRGWRNLSNRLQELRRRKHPYPWVGKF